MWKVNLNILVAVCVFLTVLTVLAAEGKLITVDDDAPADYSIIQDAINFASDGDEIEVRPGTYYEAINFKGKAVRLYSRDGSAVTIIDAGLNSSVVDCNSGEDANTILEGFTITDGNAVNGGGMHIIGSSPTVTNCIFTDNRASFNGGMGGGIFNEAASPTVTNCIFADNSAGSGGGMYNDSSSPTVTNCIFNHNLALGSPASGGGIANYNSNPTLTNCTFSLNFVGFRGGGMVNDDSSPIVINCIFHLNGSRYGGVMYNNNSNPTITNCTFSRNWDEILYVGGIFNNNGSSPTITNSILWRNGGEILDLDSPASTTTVSFSVVKGGWPGVGVIDSDPLFVAGGDYRLSSSASPCVDTGANGAPGLPATDLAGNPRIVDGDRNGTVIVDMGAYEYQSWLIRNITQDIWYETIQLAINDANNGDEIEVSPGTYYEAINFIGKAVRLYSTAGPNDTIIDGTGNYHVVQCVSGEDANTVLEGFTITGGYASGVWPDNSGGGMYNDNSSPTVNSCTFSGNVAVLGGGMYNGSSSPTVTNCIFTGNRGQFDGGGMYNRVGSSPIVTNCIFKSNTASKGGGMLNITDSNPIVNECNFSNNSANVGGGIYNTTSSPTVTYCNFSNNSTVIGGGGGIYNFDNSNPVVANCRFSGNEAGSYGGGMYNNNSSPTVTNCIFNHNIAVQASGGGIANYNSSKSIVTNCTFSGNTAVTNGGGIRNWDSSSTVTNCILWDNEPDEISSGGTSVQVVNYSDIQGGHTGTGNINTDPNFVDANNPDPNLRNLNLKWDSPCIDAGNSTILMAVPVLFDLDGKDRYVDIYSIANTGSGPWDYVDMGAYEFHCSGIPGDINCDGVVDFRDVAILCANWLAGIGP
jgi:hypothetical protein